MAQMIRKQLYIQTRQQNTLKRLSELQGVSEAELMRQAIDRQIGGVITPFVSDTAAWEEARAFMLALREREPGTGQPRQWRREDLYEERMNRYGRNPD